MQAIKERAGGGAPIHPDPTGLAGNGRIDWVDHAKGLCIIFVVMMHATLGVEKAVGEPGYMHLLVQYAKPFRMPDFFMVSGLFLGLVIDRPWRRYLDRKVVHFLYFYVLWAAIQFVLKAPGWMVDGMTPANIGREWLLSFIEPFGTLWFIYLLPIFFIVTRLLRPAPWPLVLAGAAVLEILPIHTGWTVPDEFAARYVYFLAGYLFATRIFSLAETARANLGIALAFLAAWALANGWATFSPAPGGQAESRFVSDLPVVSLVLGAAGAFAIVTITALLTRLSVFGFLGYLGRNSIVVYLAFFLPMAVSRALLLRYGDGLDTGTISLLVTACGVIGPILLLVAVRATGLGQFLFARPNWARIEPFAGPSARRILRPAE